MNLWKKIFLIFSIILTICAGYMIIRAIQSARELAASRESGIAYARAKLLAHTAELEKFIKKYPNPEENESSALMFLDELATLYINIENETAIFDSKYPRLVNEEREQTLKILETEQLNAMSRIQGLGKIVHAIEKKYGNYGQFQALKKTIQKRMREKLLPRSKQLN